MAFAHLHVHTEYSLLDGACRIERLLDRIQELGQQHVAITDHGNMYGVVDFYKAAKRRGIKPIIGCEVYVAPRGRKDKVHGLDSENRHLVLLCENDTGYRNLTAMVSLAWTEGFYSRPRVDYELLEQYHEGLIALSACISGEVPKLLLRGGYAEALAAAERMRDIFGPDNYFLELQDHGLRDEHYVNPSIIKLSQETGIPMVVTNDCHYIEAADQEMHKVLMCIQTGRTVEDENSMDFGEGELYVKSEEEMRALFPDCPEAADNTVKIAERCQVEFEFGKTKLPHFDTPDGAPNQEFFERLCHEGLVRRYGPEPDQTLKERLQYEIDTITQMGYVNYYLIVWDFIRHAKSVGIPVGPGRGSGAASLAAYSIGITNVDPIKYSLIFERFLNPERVSMPDFDIDFSDERRDEMIDYVLQKYGADHVAQIVTFGTMAARGAIRDVGRAMAVPYGKVDQVAKLVPMEKDMTLKKAIETQKEFRQRCDEDPQVKALVMMAMKVEGMPRHTSTHAAGVLITDRPVMDYVPLARNDDVIVTQFTMTTIEELGLLKMDFLGLRNLSVIDNAQKLIRKREPEFSMDAIAQDDPETFEMLKKGNTVGVFQMESAGMTRLLVQSGGSSIEDLTAIISLYRPGPMQFIPMYLENSRDPLKVSYKHPRLAGILGVTYGCIIYQEQVMEIFRELAGYSLGRADIVRRAMSKKKHDVLERERQVFIHGQQRDDGSWEVEGCVNRGVDEATASELFSEIEDFASYAFNKAHAAAYAVVAYETAYLKCHYPQEYMAALLSSVLGWSGKVAEYIEECRRMGLEVLPPHVNHSDVGFTADGSSIRFGLAAVKNLGRGAITHMVAERLTGGGFTSFYDFCTRMLGKDFNRRAIECLIKAGALDGLGNNRREMLMGVEQVLAEMEGAKRRNLEGQLGLFDTPGLAGVDNEPKLPKASEFTHMEKLTMEKEVTGMYLSGHPMLGYAELYASGAYARISGLLQSEDEERQEGAEQYRDGQRLNLLGIITEVRRKNTRAGQTMAFLTLEDLTGSITVLVFPSVLERFGELMQEGSALDIAGRLSLQEDRDPEVVCDQAAPAPKEGEAPARPVEGTAGAKKRSNSRPGLYLRLPNEEDSGLRKAMQYLDIFNEGRSDLYLYFLDSKKLVKASPKYHVEINQPLLRALEERLGKANVKYVPENRG